MKNTIQNNARVIAVLVFLTLLNILNFTDRFLMQGFAVDMIADLHLSNFQFTLLTGFVFSVFYTLMGLMMGALADRLHRPRLMAAGLLLWSVLTTATGFSRTFTQVAWVRMFIGVGETTLTPAALGLLGDIFSRKNRAFASGFYYLGSPIGIGAAFIIAGTFGAAVGWRNCFTVLGVLGVLMSTFLLLLRESRPAQQSAPAENRLPVAKVMLDIRDVLTSSPALCLVIVGGVFVIFAQGALVLDQLWLVQERGFSKQHAQNLSGALFLVGGVLGAILGGWGSDLMQSRWAGGRLYFLSIAYAIGVPVGFAFRFTDPNGSAFYLCMFIGSVMLTIGYGPLFASVQDLVPDRIRSTMTAFLILCMTLLGTSPGNLLVGLLSDHFRSAGVAEPITWAVLVCMTPWVLAIPCFYIAARQTARNLHAS